MADETSRRRRRAEAPALPLPPEHEVALTQLRRLATDQARGTAVDHGPEAIFWLSKIFASPITATGSRKGWLATLQWIDASMTFPAVSEIHAALEDLERGVVRPGLQKPVGRGQGKRASASEEKLRLLMVIVEAANELGRRHAPKARDEEIENSAGVSLNTLRRWRQILKDAPRRYHPRLAWRLYYGDNEPAEILKAGAEAYRAMP